MDETRESCLCVCRKVPIAILAMVERGTAQMVDTEVVESPPRHSPAGNGIAERGNSHNW